MDAEGVQRAKYKANYYREHREKMRAQIRAWDAENWDRQAVYQATYKQKRRPEILAKSRARYAANPTKHNERVKAYYIKNAEARRAYRKAYRAANLEQEREKDRLSKQRTKERDQPRRRQYSKDNKEKLAAAYRAFAKANPHVISFHASKRRAKIIGATVGNTDVIAEWESRWRKSPSVRCYWCMNFFPGNDCHSDHIIPLSKGGAHEIGNLCVSCPDCNHSKSARTLENWNKLIEQPALL